MDKITLPILAPIKQNVTNLDLNFVADSFSKTLDVGTLTFTQFSLEQVSPIMWNFSYTYNISLTADVTPPASYEFFTDFLSQYLVGYLQHLQMFIMEEHLFFML